MGPNGSGKSSLFEALHRVRSFVNGDAKVDELFPGSSLTLWQEAQVQSFDIEIPYNHSLYRYELRVEHTADRTQQRVALEKLSFDGRSLMTFEGGKVRLAGDYDSKVATFPFQANQSVLGSIPRDPDNERLAWFRSAIRRIFVVQILPPLMSGSTEKGKNSPDRYFRNFVSWYKWISNDQGLALGLQQRLREVLPDFSHFKFEALGRDVEILKVVFGSRSNYITSIAFDELSDGQRMLISLYALVQSLERVPDELDSFDDISPGLLCLDEPDNFISTREIQPWYAIAEEILSQTRSRAFIISHNPESINYSLMPNPGAPASAFWLDRKDGRHTQIDPITPGALGGLEPSELVARGWLKA